MIGIHEDDGHVYAEHISTRLDDLGARLRVGQFALYTFRNPKSGTDGPASAEQEAAHDELLLRDERAAEALADDAAQHARNIAKMRAERQSDNSHNDRCEAAEKPAKKPAARKRGKRVAPNGPDTQRMETVELSDGGEQ